MESKRIDLALVEGGFFTSRTKAKQALDDRVVHVNGKLVLKASHLVLEHDVLTIEGETLKYVSRGGLKMEKAIQTFNLSLKDLVVMDIGASTGGFTDCMLQNGAKMVYAVDVGTDQLSPVLRASEKVVEMSQTNVRDLSINDISGPLDFASIDVSFIPLNLVLPVAYDLLKDQGELVFLIKPQFEIGKTSGLKKGIVKDAKNHLMVLKEIVTLVEVAGFSWKALTYSPIKGPKGNIEFLAHVKKGFSDKSVHYDAPRLKEIVKKAHGHL